MKTTTQFPTIFHITHWKSGSQWIHKILIDLFQDRIISPQLMNTQYTESPLVQGGVYPTLYVTREEFEAVEIPFDYKYFVIMRDLRDTLISAYFSIRYSHPLINSQLMDWRQRMENMSLEDGLSMLIDEWLPYPAKVQQSWLKATSERIYRYEDLLNNDLDIMVEILVQRCRLSLDLNLLEKVVEKNRFQSLTQGRQPGHEDILSHERKGIRGDWGNYFTPIVEARFMDQYGDLLAGLGYV